VFIQRRFKNIETEEDDLTKLGKLFQCIINPMSEFGSMNLIKAST